ncbi:MAG: DUF4040 domain-containing protein [Hyphomicrobiaceae bacterium]
MESYINMALLTLLAATTIAIVQQRSLFAVVVLFGIYSFLMASVMMVLDALDVAMTEAAVGAGVSTVFLIGTLYLTGSMEMRPARPMVIPIFVSLATGVMLVWGTYGLPAFGIPDAPIHIHVAPYYLENSYKTLGVPNVVTTVLADYRSFDTMGETAVIFTAGIGIMLLLRKSKKSGARGKEDRS